MTRDDALLILNDRLGQPVEVITTLYRGDRSIAVMTANGTLDHWRKQPDTWAGHPREDILGLYEVGDATFDITDLSAADLLADQEREPYGLSFTLSLGDEDGTIMTVSWAS